MYLSSVSQVLSPQRGSIFMPGSGWLLTAQFPFWHIHFCSIFPNQSHLFLTQVCKSIALKTKVDILSAFL